MHLVDNITIDKNNRLVKVRQYKNIYKRLFSQFGVFTKNLSIDEEMGLYFGRSALKQYIRGKPIKFGMKLWAMAVFDGFPLDFEVYTKKDTLSDSGELVEERVVKRYIEQIDHPNEHCLYADNFFSSANLLSLTKEKA